MSSRQMKASELCKKSGMTRSALHYYVSLGLLHRPAKVGLNVHLYDETHLNRLRRIRELKEKKGLSLAEIKQVLEQADARVLSGSASEPKGEDREWLEPSARDQGEPEAREALENRDKILDMAIRLFSERGYEHTKISDITEALRMGKSTFYVYFKDKRELFLECIDRLAVTIVPRESWDEIREEQDFFRKTKKRGLAFLRAFPGYRGILTLIRGAIGGSDPVMAQKAIEAFRVLTRPMLKDLRRAVADRVLQIHCDEAFIAYLQLVIAEGFGYWQLIDPRYSVEEGMAIMVDLFEKGLVHPVPSRPERIEQPGPSGEVEDNTGVRTRLEDIAINQEPLLPGRRGEAEVEVDLTLLASLRFFNKGARRQAELAMGDGQEFVIDVDADAFLSGTAAFGTLRLPLKRIASVSLDRG